MSAVLSPTPRQQFFNPNDGTPAAGYRLFTYAAGTTTKLATYINEGALTPNTNPIILDSQGACDLWLTPGVAYKLALCFPTTTDPPTTFVPGWPVDNITAIATSGPSSIFFTSNYATPMLADAAAKAVGGTVVVDSSYTFTASQEFQSPVIFSGGPDSVWTRSSHTITFDSVVSAPETQIFDAVSTPIQFSSAQSEIFVRWFGAKADDFLHMYDNPVNPTATDDTASWQATFASAALNLTPVEIMAPLGVSKVSSSLFCTSNPTLVGSIYFSMAGVSLRGRGNWSSVLQSYLSTGTMLTVGHVAPPTISHGSNGFSLRDIGFSSAGTETLLVDINYCRAITIDHCSWIGGNNRQLDVGRAQDAFITQNSFNGFIGVDPVSGASTYSTSTGLTFTTDLAGNVAGPSFVNNNIFRDCRNSTHTGCGFNVIGGGGHRIYANEIVNNDVGLDIEVNGNSVVDNRFETSGIYFTAVAAGGNVGNGTVSYPAGQTITAPSNTGICGAPGYIFTFTGPSVATVTDPTGASLPNMIVGINYVQQGLTFKFTAGSTPWAAADRITITGTGDTCLLVGGTNTHVSFGTYNLNRFSGDNSVNMPLLNFVSYGWSQINDNFFTSANGVCVYFSADDNNSNSQFMRNNGIDVRTQVSDLSVSGKVQYRDNLDGTKVAYWAALTQNSSTPSVRNLSCADTNNTVATSITYFTGGYNGQALTLRIRDNNTTIVSGSSTGTPGSIVLLGGANQTFRMGDDIYLVAFTSVADIAAPIWIQVLQAGLGTVGVSTGTMTIKSSSVNNANSSGWFEIAPNIWVPTFTTPNP